MLLDKLRNLIPSGLLQAPRGAAPSNPLDHEVGALIKGNPNLASIVTAVRTAAASDTISRDSRWNMLTSLPLPNSDYQAVIQIRSNRVDIGYQGFGMGSPGASSLITLASRYGGPEKFKAAVTRAIDDLAEGLRGDAFDPGRAASTEPGVHETTKRYGKFQERGPALAVIEPVVSFSL